jgi:hypothetical protein
MKPVPSALHSTHLSAPHCGPKTVPLCIPPYQHQGCGTVVLWNPALQDPNSAVCPALLVMAKRRGCFEKSFRNPSPDACPLNVS